MSDVNSSQFWQELYESKNNPWDLGRPTPVFERLLRDGRLTPSKMIVLGAGAGYDAHLFARHGFEVTAVDFADDAVVKMKTLEDPKHPVTILKADIFDMPAELNNRFDTILEYTCYCAIHPSRRNEYAELAYKLLKPKGIWVALSFPIGKRGGGPPYVVQPDKVAERMTEHGFKLLFREIPPDSAENRQGIEELLIMEKQKTGH